MKKTVLTTLSAVLLLALLATCLVACNTTPNVNHIYLDFEDITSTDVSYTYIGEFTYGTPFSEIEPQYKVICVYDDRTEKELSAAEYTVSYVYNPLGGAGVSIESIPETPDVGYYEVTISVGNNIESHYNFTINRGDREYKVTFATESWTYLDAPRVSVTYADELTEVADNIYYYYISKEVYDGFTDAEKADFADNYNDLEDVKPIQNGIPITIVPGTYYAFAYIPACGNYNEAISTIDGSTTFTVTKGTLKIENYCFENAKIMIETAGTTTDIQLKDLWIWSEVKVEPSGGMSGNLVFIIYYEDTMLELVSGTLEWINGEQTVSVADIGKPFAVRFVPNEIYMEYCDSIDVTGYVIMN